MNGCEAQTELHHCVPCLVEEIFSISKASMKGKIKTFHSKKVSIFQQLIVGCDGFHFPCYRKTFIVSLLSTNLISTNNKRHLKQEVSRCWFCYGCYSVSYRKWTIWIGFIGRDAWEDSLNWIISTTQYHYLNSIDADGEQFINHVQIELQPDYSLFQLNSPVTVAVDRMKRWERKHFKLCFSRLSANEINEIQLITPTRFNLETDFLSASLHSTLFISSPLLFTFILIWWQTSNQASLSIVLSWVNIEIAFRLKNQRKTVFHDFSLLSTRQN